MKTVKLDMHLHSEYSHDGCVPVAEIVALAKAKGMNAFVVTDHDSIASYEISRQFSSDDFLVIPAVEYTTTRGHILVYFIDKHAEEDGLRRENGKYKFEEIIAFTRKNGGLAFAAHVFKHAKPPFAPKQFQDVFDAVSGIEIYNGRCSALHTYCNIGAKKIIQQRKSPFSAGSDGHAKHEMFRAYRIFEFADDETITLESLKAKLLIPSGAYFSHPTPSLYITYTKLRLSLRSCNAKRIIKYLLQICYCLLFDLIRVFQNLFTGKLKPSINHIEEDTR